MPRHIRGAATPSLHAFGRAVDVNAATNPRLRDLVGGNAARVAVLLEVIERVTSVDLDRARDYATQRQASLALQAAFGVGFDAWLAAQRSWLDDFLRPRVATAQQNLQQAIDHGEDRSIIESYRQALDEARQAVRGEEQFLRRVRGVRRAISSLATTGFVSLAEGVVTRFQNQGFTCGGEWSAAYKDYMHFERGAAEP